MSSFLTIAGGGLQVVGVILVFAELAAVRAHEFHIPAPWTTARQWLRAKLRRPQVVQISAALEADSALSVRGKRRPASSAADASEADRIARLERYVKYLDEDIDEMWNTIAREKAAAIAEAERGDQQLRQEHEAHEMQRRAQLRWSLIRQAVGATCLLLGVVLAALGAVV